MLGAGQIVSRQSSVVSRHSSAISRYRLRTDADGSGLVSSRRVLVRDRAWQWQWEARKQPCGQEATVHRQLSA